MLNVVSNTTPILCLLKLKRLALLKALYGQIKIPQAVYKEIEAGRNKDYYQDLLASDWVSVHEVKNEQAVKDLTDLDAGEAEAIVLAAELCADLLLIDEKRGRIHAKHAALNITGTMGILIKAKRTGLINALKPLLIELEEKGIWLGRHLIEAALLQADEK